MPKQEPDVPSPLSLRTLANVPEFRLRLKNVSLWQRQMQRRHKDFRKQLVKMEYLIFIFYRSFFFPPGLQSLQTLQNSLKWQIRWYLYLLLKLDTKKSIFSEIQICSKKMYQNLVFHRLPLPSRRGVLPSPCLLPLLFHLKPFSVILLTELE